MAKLPPTLPGCKEASPGSSHLFNHALDQAVGCLQVLRVAALQEPGQELSGQGWDSSEQQPLGTVLQAHITHERHLLQEQPYNPGNMSAPVP